MSPDLNAWLLSFRRAVPRPQRQALIDSTDLDRALDRLAEKPPSLRVLKYSLVVYLLAARAPQQPVTPELRGDRDARLQRVAEVFARPASAVAKNLEGLMARLRRDHLAWRRRGERKAAASGEGRPALPEGDGDPA